MSKLLSSAPAGQNGTGYDFTLLEISNDVVSLKATAHASIEDKYTYYTKTDKGAIIANKLFSFCEVLNDYHNFIHQYHFTAEASTGRSSFIPPIGVEYVNGTFRPQLNFIREKE